MQKIRSESLLSLLCVGFVATSHAQDIHHDHKKHLMNNQALSTQVDPPGIIDGSKNPELVPDDVAWRLFLRAVAEPLNATPDQLLRLTTKISRAGLDMNDTAVFISVISDFHGRIATLDQEVARLQGSNPNGPIAALPQMKSRIAELISNTVGDLNSRLSSAGMNKLRAHVSSIKRNIKSVPLPAMPN